MKTETWKAWTDNDPENFATFEVPLGGTCDVADAGAMALGIDVCEELNVARA